MDRLKQNEILFYWHRGQSMREIARRLRVSRNTVRRVLSSFQRTRQQPSHGNGESHSQVRRRSLLDRHEAFLRQLLGRYPDASVVQILERLRGEGFEGGYSILRQRVREIRGSMAQDDSMPSAAAPGAVAYVEFRPMRVLLRSTGLRLLYLFRYQLAYSRRQYLQFTERRDFVTTVYQHVEAFHYFQGVAAFSWCWQTPGIADQSGPTPELIPRFLDFANHYGFRPALTADGRSFSDGNAFAAPRAVLELAAREHRSREGLNAALRCWLEGDSDLARPDERVHALFRQEHPHLIPLPSCAWQG